MGDVASRGLPQRGFDYPTICKRTMSVKYSRVLNLPVFLLVHFVLVFPQAGIDVTESGGFCLCECGDD